MIEYPMQIEFNNIEPCVKAACSITLQYQKVYIYIYIYEDH